MRVHDVSCNDFAVATCVCECNVVCVYGRAHGLSCNICVLFNECACVSCNNVCVRARSMKQHVICACVRVRACVVCVRVWFLKPMIYTIRSCAGWH